MSVGGVGGFNNPIRQDSTNVNSNVSNVKNITKADSINKKDITNLNFNNKLELSAPNLTNTSSPNPLKLNFGFAEPKSIATKTFSDMNVGDMNQGSLELMAKKLIKDIMSFAQP